ncbi:hypothetical protein J2S36_000087 [Arcanobacterium hippocoleae]|uniref:Uncharacterized protein n=1 Tax=Arcanobacterium hippocoleae TaxID=149017 RepID=A0ABU1SZJ1_9ACTO|nr:hypothetical protein [Arcanobacterium hippocoleae]
MLRGNVGGKIPVALLGLLCDTGFDGGDGEFASGCTAGMGEDIRDVGAHCRFSETSLLGNVFVREGFQQQVERGAQVLWQSVYCDNKVCVLFSVLLVLCVGVSENFGGYGCHHSLAGMGFPD